MKKNKRYSNNIRYIDCFKFAITTVIVPIFISGITSYITFKVDKPKEYLIRESFNLEKLDVTKYFPLSKGNYWIYSRDFTFANGDGTDKRIKDEVKVEVIDKYKNDDKELFVIKGDPLAEKEAENVVYGYIVLAKKIIKVPSDKIDLFIDIFKNKSNINREDTKGLYIEYEFPLYNGEKYGEFSELFRSDSKNISYVTKLTPYRKKVGENIMDIGIYQIDNLYNSGDGQKIFTPYLGITEMSYEHRGTTNKYIIDLKEYKLKDS